MPTSYLTEKEQTYSPKVQNYLEGTRKAVEVKGGGGTYMSGSSEVTDNAGNSITADQIRERLAAYQQSTTERRATTERRMEDYDARVGEDTSATPQGRYQKDTAGNQVVDKISGKNVITGAEPKPKEPLTGIDLQISQIEADAGQQVAYINKQLDRIGNQANGAYRQMVEATKQIYGARIQEMRDANERLRSLKETVGVRTGRQRYTPVHQAGIIADEEIAGAQRIAKLEGEMLGALASAAQAKADDDLKRFNASYDRIETVEKNMQAEIKNLYDAAVAQEEAIAKQQKASSDAAKDDFQRSLDISERSAPAIAKSLAEKTDPLEQAAIINELAERLNVDPLILLSDAYNSMDDQAKAAIDRRNVENQILNRNRGTAVTEARYQLDYEKQAFNPTAEERALVGRYIQSDEGRKEYSDGQTLTPGEMDELMRDPTLFYHILSAAKTQYED